VTSTDGAQGGGPPAEGPVTADPATAVYRLATGEVMTVSLLQPPLGEYAERIEYWWRDIRAPLVAGDLAATSLDTFVVGEVDGEYAGSMTYATPRDTRDVAVLGMVWTRPDQRRKGVARTLLAHALAAFRAGGGRAMYLCTTNPAAFDLYAAAGFRSLVGDGMRYLAPGNEDFDDTYFSWAGPATIRDATWGDLARVAALYNQPAPDWLVKDYHAPRRVFRDGRYESHYLRVWKPARDGRGCLLVLETSRGTVVGIASAVETETFYEQHVHLVDGWACPAYLDVLPALLGALAERAAEGGAEVLQAWVAAGDTAKAEAFRRAGFEVEARLRDRLRTDEAGQGRADLLVYSRFLGRQGAPRHALETYYGARRPIHGARAARTARNGG
jgi:L-amino acid N-acyltransferase YncA